MKDKFKNKFVTISTHWEIIKPYFGPIYNNI